MNLLQRVSRWWNRKSAMDDDTGWLDLPPRRAKQPSPTDLLAELKSTAWACATINATTCAALPPRLFVALAPGMPRPRCLTRALDPGTSLRLKGQTPGVATSQIEEVVDHPLLSLLTQVNPVHNGFDLWEMTQLSLEIHGSAYWLLDLDPLLQQPRAIWILPAHLVAPVRDPNSTQLVDAYEYRGQTPQRYAAERVVAFRCPDPRDPYTSGISPLKACFDQAALVSEFANLKRNVYDNAAVPSVLLTPDNGMSSEERQRLETQWRQKFRNGQGGVVVANDALKVTPLSHSLGDLSALADIKASKADIANAFCVPLPFLSGETNLANMQAADHLHKTLAILPRLRRRDEKLNEQLIPRFDSSGRLFFATPDPTPANQAFVLQQEQADLKLGVRTVNEVRAARGLPPVAWGDGPRGEGN